MSENKIIAIDAKGLSEVIYHSEITDIRQRIEGNKVVVEVSAQECFVQDSIDRAVAVGNATVLNLE